MNTLREQAEKAAEERYPALNNDHESLTYPREVVRGHARTGFTEGFLAGHAAALTKPTEGEVERVADVFESLYDADAAARYALAAFLDQRREGER